MDVGPGRDGAEPATVTGPVPVQAPAAKAFPPSVPRGEGRPLSVCIVTFEAVGFWRNGGIGTVSTGLAELLAAAGHHVTLAFTRADMLTPEEFEAAAQRYVDQGIRVVPVSRSRLPPLTGPLEGFTCWERYAVYDWLKGERFDVVHSSEHLGETYYCLVAKHLGLGFADTQFWIGCHGPSAWVIDANDEVVRDRFWLWTDAAERFVLAQADLVWAPSRYLLGWMAEKGFALPAERTFLQTYRIPDDLGPVKARDRAPAGRVSELVFFGRLEPRKGVKLFLEAVTALKDRLADVRITFMGRPATIDGRPADLHIADRMAGTGLSWGILDSLDRFEAYSYVTAPGRVAVLASPVDNSPCAVYELLEVEASFIACAGGGIPELIDPGSHAGVLFAYTVESLTARLHGVLDGNLPTPQPAATVARPATEAAWNAAHARLPNELARTRTAAGRSRSTTVTALVLYDGAPDALSTTLGGLRDSGPAVADILLVTSDRRGVLPADLHPDIRRASLDVLGHRAIGRELAKAGRPALLLRSGAFIGPDGIARLLAGLGRADAIVPFGYAREADGSVLAEPVLPGGWAWTVLHGAASVGGLISAEALGIVARRERDIPGADPLLWFDAAVLAGLSVVPLAEILIDLTAVDRTTHAAADTRARLSLTAGALPLDQRLLFEAAYGALVPPPVAAAPAEPEPEPAAMGPPEPTSTALSLVGQARRFLQRAAAR